MKRFLNNGWLLLLIFPVSMLIYSFVTGNSIVADEVATAPVIERLFLTAAIIAVICVSYFWNNGISDREG